MFVHSTNNFAQEIATYRTWKAGLIVSGSLLTIAGIAFCILSQHPPSALFSNPHFFYASCTSMVVGVSAFMFACHCFKQQNRFEKIYREEWTDKIKEAEQGKREAQSELDRARAEAEKSVTAAREARETKENILNAEKIRQGTVMACSAILTHAAVIKNNLERDSQAFIDLLEEEEKQVERTTQALIADVQKNPEVQQRLQQRLEIEEKTRHLSREILDQAEREKQEIEKATPLLVEEKEKNALHVIESAKTAADLRIKQIHADPLFLERMKQRDRVVSDTKYKCYELVREGSLKEQEIERLTLRIKSSHDTRAKLIKDTAAAFNRQSREEIDKKYRNWQMRYSSQVRFSSDSIAQVNLYGTRKSDLILYYDKEETALIHSKMFFYHGIADRRGFEKNKDEMYELDLRPCPEWVVLAFLDFIYTGKISTEMTWKMTWNDGIYLYHLATYFCLDTLQEHAQEFLRRSIQYEQSFFAVIMGYFKLCQESQSNEGWCSLLPIDDLVEWFYYSANCVVSPKDDVSDFLDTYSDGPAENLIGVLGVIFAMATRSHKMSTLERAARTARLEIAIENKSAFASLIYGESLLLGKGLDQNVEKGLLLLTTFADQGNPHAQVLLFEHYKNALCEDYQNSSNSQNLAKARKYLEAAAAKKFPKALHYLALAYDHVIQIGFGANKYKALKLYELAEKYGIKGEGQLV